MATRSRSRPPALRLSLGRVPSATPVVDHLRANAAVWALFVAAALWIGWFATRVHVYFVMPDELRYLKQAIAWGSGRPVLPGTETWVTASQIQPLLLAPVWALLSSWRAYQLSHVETSLIFASAVFPVYLLARRVLGSKPWALAAAAMSIVIPWSVMTGVLMLENTAYPAALWALLAVHVAVVSPSRRADLVALGALLVAYFARSQLLVLWVTLPVGLVVQGLRFPPPSIGPTRRLRAIVTAHWPVFALSAAVVIAGAIDKRTLVGNSPRGAKLLDLDSFAFGREMLIYVALGIGMVPLALSIAWVLATVTRPRTVEDHAYAVMLVVVTALLAIVVGGGSRVFAPDQLRGVNDRYLLYAAPLLIIGMLAFLLDRRRLTAWTLVGGVLAAWMAWASHLLLAGATFVTPTATYHVKLNEYADDVGGWLGAAHFTSGKLAALVTVIGCVLIALAKRWVRPPVVAAVVAALVGVYCFNETNYTRDKLLAIQPAADYGRGRDWADRVLPRGGRAAVLLSPLGVGGVDAAATWWDLTFWNKKAVANRYALSQRVDWDGQGVPHRVTIDPEQGRTSGFGGLHYLIRGVADRRFGFVGESTLGAPHNNLQAWSLPSHQLRWWFEGVDETGKVEPGSEARVHVFGAGEGGEREVSFPLGTRFGATKPAAYEVLAGDRVLARGTAPVRDVVRPRVRVSVPANGHADVVLRAPAGGGSTGVQFYGAIVSPAAT